MTTIKKINSDHIKSRWYKDILTEWKPDREHIEFIKKKVRLGDYIPPLLVVKEGERYILVNGHHRLVAFLELEKREVSCIVLSGTFEETEPLRQAEILLKKFDEQSEYRYKFSGHLDRWAASLEQKNYINAFRPTLTYRLYMKIRTLKNKLFRSKSP